MSAAAVAIEIPEVDCLPADEPMTLDEFLELKFDEPVDFVEGRITIMGNPNPFHS